MSESNPSDDIRWSSRWLFVLAAAGSAVGLGNIWKFPYVAGENGGGAFVLIYLVCVGLVGAPIMMAEIALGREGRSSPITTMTKLAASAGRNSQWSIIGWMGVIAGVMILSFYAVIAGWALKYIGVLASGEFENAGAQVVESTFNGLLASPVEMILWQTVFMVGTIWIVARGVSKGLEQLELLARTVEKFDFAPLRKIASGGEMTRVNLAIQAVAAKNSHLPCLILDEADVGVGGTVSDSIGRLLRALSETTQVLCVTHAPQVAAIGQKHFKVTRENEKTNLMNLEGEDRVKELARMLAGSEVTPETTNFAKNLLAQAMD